MSADSSLALLLDGPLQSWGHSSRFTRRTTALHATRSGVFGLIAAALGIDKHRSEEAGQLVRYADLKMMVISLPRRDRWGAPLLIRRLEDYHTVTGIRRASGKVDLDATVLTYRHYLLDARFGVVLKGATHLLDEIAAALRNPRWGSWLGRKCCIPATPLLAAAPGSDHEVWVSLLKRAGYSGEEPLTSFDHVVEATAADFGADIIEDRPLSYGAPIGERHAPRWIRQVPRAGSN